MLQKSAQPSKHLVKALRFQLRPLVKLLLKSGITFPFLADLLKQIFIEVADSDFRLEGKQQTDSRINFLTGIHRKDVKKLRNNNLPDNAIPNSVSLGAQVVANWIGNDAYLDSRNKPLPLPRLIKNGGEQSFEALVILVNKDIRSRAVLDEWLNLGVVSLDDKDRVCLNTQSFVPEKGFDEKAWFFGEHLHDHMAAAVHNLLGEKPPFLERAVFYDQLSQYSVDKLKKIADQSGMRLLRKLNKKAMELQSNDKASPESHNLRMRFGIYFYNELEIPQDESSDD
ncbi:MAG: DUF6502 family protein [Methylophagaceae bacterium]